jgi:hypothetical protein
MAEQSSQAIVIDAPPAKIMDVIADFPAYPEWARAVRTCEVIEDGPDGRARQVHFVIDTSVVKDDYVLEYDWQGTHRVSWRLVRGQMQKTQQGSYVLQPQPLGTKVTYNLTVDLVVPMLGMLKRKAEKVIMDTALKELKKRVEG